MSHQLSDLLACLGIPDADSSVIGPSCEDLFILGELQTSDTIFVTA